MSQVFVSKHPLVQHKLTLLRDVQTDHRSFRELTRELCLLLMYEATHDLKLAPKQVTTPMATTTGSKAEETIGLVPILRAGLGMVEGALALLPNVQVWHLGFYRDEKSLRPVAYYNRLPDAPTVQLCLVLDPMLATGGSAVSTIDLLRKHGARRIRLVCLLAAPEGVECVNRAHPDVPILTASLDQRLNDRGYIVPGLGDAGDRCFGT